MTKYDVTANGHGVAWGYTDKSEAEAMRDFYQSVYGGDVKVVAWQSLEGED